MYIKEIVVKGLIVKFDRLEFLSGVYLVMNDGNIVATIAEEYIHRLKHFTTYNLIKDRHVAFEIL